MRAMLDQLMGTGRDGEKWMGVFFFSYGLLVTPCVRVVDQTSRDANRIALPGNLAC